MFKSKDVCMFAMLNLSIMAIVIIYTMMSPPQDKIEKESSVCIQDLKECAEELSGPKKCGKLWNYTQQLEAENAKLNKMLRTK